MEYVHGMPPKGLSEKSILSFFPFTETLLDWFQAWPGDTLRAGTRSVDEILGS